MEILIQLELKDKITKEVWRTPNHSNKKVDDDYHNVIKPQIKARVSADLKKRIGNNFDIEMRDGEMWAVSQVFSKDSGVRKGNALPINLPTGDFFKKIANMLLVTLLDELVYMDYEAIAVNIVRDEHGRLGYSITLSIDVPTP